MLRTNVKPCNDFCQLLCTNASPKSYYYPKWAKKLNSFHPKHIVQYANKDVLNSLYPF